MGMISRISAGCLMWVAMITTVSAADDTLCTPNPSAEAVALYRFLHDIRGDKILSGQMLAPYTTFELNYVQSVTGKKPAILGLDFILQGDNNTVVQTAINWWKSGGIPTIMWHCGAPGKGEGYENSKMQIDIDRCFIEGTAEYTAFRSELDAKADLLEKLRDANVPVLWRPYHELNGNWFWWGKQGSERFIKLWRTMYDYFVNVRGLNNLIWVLCYTGDPDPLWYPGDEYVDIAGADTYDAGNGPQPTMYNKVKSIIRDRYPIAYHECGIPPDPDQCLSQNIIWSWWMEWHSSWVKGVDTAYLKKVYRHDLVLTKDELPDIMSIYGYDSLCRPSAVDPFYRVNNGAWQTGNKIAVRENDSVFFFARVTDEGVMTWNADLAGSDSVRKLTFINQGSVTAMFTNTCGAVTSVSYNLADQCPAPVITPYMRINDGAWQNTTSVSITYGAAVRLAPQPISGGTWKWTGALTSSSREISLVPVKTCTLTAEFTNTCGKTSRKNFNITVNCPSTTITPFMQVNQEAGRTVSNITIYEGDSVILSPRPLTGGSWNWTGAVTDTARQVMIKPAVTCSTKVVYTNECGTTSQKLFTITVMDRPVSIINTINGDINIYPNPASNQLKIHSRTDISGADAVILSAGGKVLSRIKLFEQTSLIDIHSLEPGLYILSIRDREGTRNFRFTKQ